MSILGFVIVAIRNLTMSTEKSTDKQWFGQDWIDKNVDQRIDVGKYYVCTHEGKFAFINTLSEECDHGCASCYGLFDTLQDARDGWYMHYYGHKELNTKHDPK